MIYSPQMFGFPENPEPDRDGAATETAGCTDIAEGTWAGLNLDSVTELSDPGGFFSTGPMSFTDLAPGDLSDPFDMTLTDLSQDGLFSGQYRFNLSDEKDLPRHAGQQTLVLNVTATVVPEPRTLALLRASELLMLGYGWRCGRRMAIAYIDARTTRARPRMKYSAGILGIAICLCASGANSQTLITPVQFTGTGGTASDTYPRERCLMAAL
jgi:hypothetical protein